MRSNALDAAGLTRALVAVALVVAVIGSLGAPLITSVALGFRVSLDAAQWTLTVTLFTGAIAGPLLARLGSGSHRRQTILVTLALVALGGVLTTFPFPFVVLLVGRALQGLGLGVIALLMGVARSTLPANRSGSTIAALSVASTVGIGVGYPLVGLVDQLAGLRAAYAIGLVLSVAALVVAWRSLPADTPGETGRPDIPGTVLLAAATFGALVLIADPTIWASPWAGVAILAGVVVVLVVWCVLELRIARPLVDVRLLGRWPVLRANLAMLVGGIGMYLLFSLLTRYLETPATAGYGFGLPGVLVGAALIPFSVFGFLAGRLAPAASGRLAAPWIYLAAAAAVIIAGALFAILPGSLVAVLGAMALLGFGVGGVSAVMPRMVLGGVPGHETASVLSINQLVRSVGFSIGSAVAGSLLAGAVLPGATIPAQHGYVSAALWVVPLLAASALIVLIARRRALAGTGTDDPKGRR